MNTGNTLGINYLAQEDAMPDISLFKSTPTSYEPPTVLPVPQVDVRDRGISAARRLAVPQSVRTVGEA